jgi:Zn-dependent protease with chaperone function
LTKPSPSFRKHAWLAVLSLAGFVAVYLSLTVWLGSVIYRFLRDGIHGNILIGILESVVPSLMFFVLVRGLFAVKRGKDPNTVELHPSDEPELFAFLYDIADRARAPRPHRVFLAPNVQAGVAFDLSFINLLIPTKKNLMIGLGLINVLTVSEFGAVLAHEFGHFAQRTMAVGRWVYMAEQIAGHIALSRGKLDRFLDGLSVQDPRIAWIGWVLRLCLWAVRSVLDTVYLLVTLQHRALSREMELQADLVAASLTGSDALVHALRKTHMADQSYGASLDVLVREFHRGALIKDLFALQTRHAENIRRVCDDPNLGLPPPLPAQNREKHRVFTESYSPPSAMWSTHPPDREREDNLKQRYVACDLDDRSGWVLFKDPRATREKVTAHMLEVYKQDLAKQPATAQQAVPATPEKSGELPLDEALGKMDAIFQRAFHAPVYRGVYLGRDLTRSVRTVDELFDSTVDPALVAQPPELAQLYPQEQRQEIEAWRQILSDYHTLKGLVAGRLKQSGRRLRFRGEEVAKHALPGLLEKVEREKVEAEQKVCARDRHQRAIHQQIAKTLGNGWAEYHRSLVALVHYAEHTAADITDVDGYVSNVIAIVTADGHVSRSEMQQLQQACAQAYDVLAMAFGQATSVTAPPRVLEKLCKALNLTTVFASWTERLGPFTLTKPYVETLGQWLAPGQTWFRSVAMDFVALADAAVEELLETEALLREQHALRESEGWTMPQAPEPGRVPQSYVTMQPGSERKRQDKLGWWDRFKISDGVVPGTLRAAVALSILGGLGFLAQIATDHNVVVFNGLNTSVTVHIGPRTAVLRPQTSRVVSLGSGDRVRVRTEDDAHRVIEQFEQDVSNAQATYVYNVARAGLLYEQTIIYRVDSSDRTQQEPVILGNERWIENDSHVRFADPPRTASVSRGSRSTTRRVLNAATMLEPSRQVALLRGADNQRALVKAHLSFDPAAGRLRSWLRAAANVPSINAELADILQDRVRVEPSTALRRALQDVSTAERKTTVCQRDQQLAQSEPSADNAYLAARCMTDVAAQTAAFAHGRAQYPQNPYFAWAVASDDARHGRWAQAREGLSVARAQIDLQEDVGLLLARVLRVEWMLENVNGRPNPGHAALGSLTEESEQLQALLQAEQVQSDEPPGPIHQLARGNLNFVITSRESAAATRQLLFLIACSDGASQEQMDRAFAALDQGPVDSSAFWMIALALKARGQLTPALTTLLETTPAHRELLQWMQALRQGEQVEPPASVDHPTAVTLGLVIRGSDAPAAWRAEARGFFFQAERPYFAP